VDLVANTAQFSGDLGKASQDAENFGKTAAAAGEQVDFSMAEARGSTALLGEELGVHIPRHLQTLIAEIPGVGAAFATMLPIVGVVAAIGIIEKLIEKHAEAAQALASGWEKSAEGITDHNDKLDLSIAKYEQLIDKLEGVPNNGLDVALAQARVEADELSKSLKTDVDELDKLLEKGARGGLMAKLLGESGTDQAKNIVAGLSDAMAQVPHDSNFGPNMQQVIKDAWQRAQSEINKNNSSDAGAFKDITASNEALQKLQQNLSGYLQELQKTGEDDSLKKHAADLQADAEAARKAAAAYNTAMDAVIRSGRAQIAQEKAIVQARKQAADEAESMAELEARATASVTEGLQKQASEQEKTQQQMNDETLKNAMKSAETQYKIAEEANKHLLQLHKLTAAQAAQEDAAAAQKETAAEVKALNDRLASLNSFDKDYAKEKQRLQNELAQIEQQGDAKVKQIQDQSQVQQLQSLTQAENRMGQIFAQTAAKSILEGKNMAQGMERAGAQMLQQALENLLQMETIQGRKKLSDAKTAAADAYQWAAPAGPIAGGAAAALAFASVMAFERGGEVPGVGSGDTVPAMLTPGETVVTKALTDQVRGNTGGGGSHMTYAPVIHAVDGDGVERMLKKHSAVFHAELKSTLRKHGLKG
jgi:hypothetical protein